MLMLLFSVSFSAFALLICVSFLRSNYFIFHKPCLWISDLSTRDNFPLLLLSAWLLLIDLHWCFSLLAYNLFFLLGLFIFLVIHIIWVLEMLILFVLFSLFFHIGFSFCKNMGYTCTKTLRLSKLGLLNLM